MDFQTLSKLASLLSKPFAQEFFRLLLIYRTISASEAASRLNLHIKTAQDFLEGLETLGIVTKEEVFEKKRPYFRYALMNKKIKVEFDLEQLKMAHENERALDTIWIKEKKKANCVFKSSPRGDVISSITLFSGKSRGKEERKIILTESQGRFLYYLPFPTEAPQSIRHILKKASLDVSYADEILDIVRFLSDRHVIERTRGG